MITIMVLLFCYKANASMNGGALLMLLVADVAISWAAAVMVRGWPTP